MTPIEKIRNLAIVAHIDHGKTTLIDSIFRSVHAFRENAHVEDRVMDNNELEKERGITIRAKHCTVEWNDYLINIIDTPGHADFSGEVERILSMVDTVLLLVDANEGPMPQTRYVLMRALKLGFKPIVIINKADRPNAEPDRVLDKTFDLFVELGANDEQCDFPVLYGSGLHGWLVRNLNTDPHEGLDALFQTIVDYVPAPSGDQNAPFLMQISSLGWHDHIGRTGMGRVLQGTLKKSEVISRMSTQWKKSEWEQDAESKNRDEWEVTDVEQARALYLWTTHGLDTVACDEVIAGDIITIAGPKTMMIGDTIASLEYTGKPLPPLDIEEPTVSMLFMVNNGPFAGKDGDAVTIRQIRARLEKEKRTNVALRIENSDRSDAMKVSGRGELQLAILIEEMRRENMELCVSAPEIITHRDANGKLLEPMEELTIDVPSQYQGAVIEKLAARKGQLKEMETKPAGLVRLEFRIPTRGLLGYRNEFLTDTRGLGIMASRFTGYGPWCGEVVSRNRGSLVSMDTGEATSYSLENLQQRGALFLTPMTPVYAGMIVGENSRPGDMPCNPTKKKALTNHRASGRDNAVALNTPRLLALDAALEWIAQDELVEVTPKNVRVRKILLSHEDRKKEVKRTTAVVE